MVDLAPIPSPNRPSDRTPDACLHTDEPPPTDHAGNYSPIWYAMGLPDTAGRLGQHPQAAPAQNSSRRTLSLHTQGLQAPSAKPRPQRDLP